MTTTPKKARQKCYESLNRNSEESMKRVLAENGLYTCWSCGGANMSVQKDKESKGLSWFVRCEDCGEQTLNAKTEKLAKDAWNKTYAIPLA